LRSTVAKAKAKAGRPAALAASAGDTLVRALMVVLFGLTPLVVSPAGLDKFRLPKDVVFVVLTGALAAAFLLTRNLRRLPMWRWFSWESFLALGLLYALVQGFVVGRSDQSWPALLWVACGVMVLFVVSQAASQSFLLTLWLVLSAGSAINAFFAILEYFGVFPLFTRMGGETLYGRETPAGLIGDVNSGGFLFGLCALMMLYPLAAQKRRGVRFLAASLLVLNLAGLLVTQTITAIAAFAFALFLWVVFSLWWMVRTRRAVRRAVTAIALVLILGLVSSVTLVKFTNAGKRVGVTLGAIRRGDLMVATSGRYPVFLITWSMIKERPWFGRGLDTFGADFYHFRANTAMSKLPMVNQPGAFRETHNEYLQVWEELGIVGLAFFLGLLLVPVVTAFWRARASADSKTFYLWGQLSIGVVYVGVCSLGFFPFRLSPTALGIILLLAGLRRLAWGDPPVDSAPIREGRAWRLGLGAVLAACVAYPGIQLWRANVQAGMAAYVLDQSTASDLSRWRQRIYAETAMTHLRDAEALWPRMAEVYNLQGSANMMLNQYDEAVLDYRQAAARGPCPEVMTNLAVALMASGNRAEAAQLLEAALRYNASYDKAIRALNYLRRSRP
jgi:O-antigen ligase